MNRDMLYSRESSSARPPEPLRPGLVSYENTAHFIAGRQSSSAVRAFFIKIASHCVSPRVGLVSIGPKTTQALERATPGRVTEARKEGVEGLVEAVIRTIG